MDTMMMSMMGVACSWDLGSFLQNSKTTLQTWGGYLIMLIGVVMVIASVYMIAKGLITHGKGQPVSWPVAIILLILGGAFLTGGWSFVNNIASGGQKTIEDLGNGTVIVQTL